jgi:tetratricopeptide (TPR) repeat protein
MLVSGIIPPLADGYFQRLESGTDLKAGLFPGETVVLTHGEETETAPSAQGGTGKTQLAVEFTHALQNDRAVDVLVWVTAATREALVSGFAQAAGVVGTGDPDADAVAAAGRFTAWLGRTERRWALILDDLADAADLEGLWPAGPHGQIVITTRLPAAAFGVGAHASGGGLRIVPVGGFSRREALSYLSSRLADYAYQRIEALDLAADLDGLPIGLAQATAVMNANRLSCQEYRAQFGERRAYMSGRPVEGVSAAVLAAWSLAAECAHQLAPSGLAWAGLALTSMLDPHGIPGAVLTSPAACGFIAGRPSSAADADQNLARTAITNLARVGLVSIDPAGAIRTVRMHRCIQAAVRAYLPPAETDQVLIAAADALIQAWPERASGPNGGAGLDQALRDCAISLGAAAGGQRAQPGDDTSSDASPGPAGGAQGVQGVQGPRPGPPESQHGAPAHDALWRPAAHPLLFRLGWSLEDTGLADSALAYWQSMVAATTWRLGPAHADSLAAKDRLAVAYESAGRLGDAIAMFAGALSDQERSRGTGHPDTIATRGRLAHAYASAGLPAEAVALYEQAVAESGRQLGLGHPITLAARAGLAEAYAEAGRTRESLTIYQMLSVDTERLLGPRHPTALAARDNLAAAFLANGQAKEAVDRYKHLLADYEAMSGRDDPGTIATRASLASAFRQSGKSKDAIGQYKRVLEDRERTAGADHPDAIAARANLAFAYRSAGQLRDAIREYERTLADAERALGPGDTETLSTRASLAAALHAGGRGLEAVAVLQRALADSEHYLGPDHPMTKTVRGNLDAATRT